MKDGRVLKLCNDIGSEATIDMFKKQLYRARYKAKRETFKPIFDKYLQDIDRLENAIRYAKELNVSYFDSNLHKQAEEKIKDKFLSN